MIKLMIPKKQKKIDLVKEIRARF